MITFQVGSHLYKTNHSNSDNDYIVIGSSVNQECTAIGLNGRTDHQYLTAATFQEMLDAHDIKALEVFFFANNAVQLNLNGFKFKINHTKLRDSISATSSNSWVKCKKKLADGEFYIGQKSLFHSIRILMFGISIAKTGRIEDYSCANMVYTDVVVGDKRDWAQIKEKYQPIYNNLKSEFKKWAPK